MDRVGGVCQFRVQGQCSVIDVDHQIMFRGEPLSKGSLLSSSKRWWVKGVVVI